VRNLVRDLNTCYRGQRALHARDFTGDGFAWLDCDDAAHSVLVYRRCGGADGEAVVALNFTPEPRPGYRLGLPRSGRWRELLNSDSEYYGGSGVGNLGRISVEQQPAMGQQYSASVTLPPLGGIILMPEGKVRG
jgi:1,4-alpha-glucan branching enzyme